MSKAFETGVLDEVNPLLVLPAENGGELVILPSPSGDYNVPRLSMVHLLEANGVLSLSRRFNFP